MNTNSHMDSPAAPRTSWAQGEGAAKAEGNANKILVDAFEMYNQQTSLKDINFVDRCNKTMDTLLVFAGLFSAIVTAFIVQLSTGNPQDRTNDLLVELIRQSNSTGANMTAATYRADINKHPDPTPLVLVNVFLICSLTITLLGALTAMLIKQWSFDFIERASTGSRAQEKARSRRRARGAIDRSNFNTIISLVPITIHIGLACFLVALLIWLYENGQIAAFASVVVMTGTGFVLYMVAMIAGLINEDSPFQSAVVVFVRFISKRVRRWRHRGTRNRPKKGPKFNTSILVAADPRADEDALLRNFNSEDVAILCQVVEESIYVAQACPAIHKLRNIMLLQSFDPQFGFKSHFDTETTPCRRRALVKKCIGIATTSIFYRENTPRLVEGALDQARVVCGFLETYLQIPWPGDNYFALLQNPIVRDLFEALHEYCYQNDGSPTDFMTAMSAYSLYNHRIARPAEGCTFCINGDGLIGAYMIKSDQMLPKNDWDWDVAYILRAHRLLRVFVTCMTECILGHWKDHPHLKDRHVVILYRKPLQDGIKRLNQGSEELTLLAQYLSQKKQGAAPGSFAYEWLEALMPSGGLKDVSVPQEDGASEIAQV